MSVLHRILKVINDRQGQIQGVILVLVVVMNFSLSILKYTPQDMVKERDDVCPSGFPCENIMPADVPDSVTPSLKSLQ